MEALACGYTRVSTEEMAREGVSLAMQEQRINHYAAAMGLKLVQVFCDDGISGGKPLAERPAGRNVMDLVRRKQIQAVIVFKLDRLGRTTLDVLNSVEEMDKKGVSIHSITETLDTGNPVGRFVLRTLASLSEMERDTIRARTKAALEHKRSCGKRAGSVPFGWNVAADGDTLIENETELKALASIRNLRDHGKSFRDIATWLEENEVQTKHGGTKWHASAVRSVLLHSKHSA